MRDFVVLSVKMIRKKDEIGFKERKSGREKRVEENDIHVKRRSEERRDAPK